MKKLRVYEYARELGMTSKEVITMMRRLGISVQNHMSLVDEEARAKVEAFFAEVRKKAALEKLREEKRQAAQMQTSTATATLPPEETLGGEAKRAESAQEERAEVSRIERGTQPPLREGEEETSVRPAKAVPPGEEAEPSGTELEGQGEVGETVPAGGARVEGTTTQTERAASGKSAAEPEVDLSHLKRKRRRSRGKRKAERPAAPPATEERAPVVSREERGTGQPAAREALPHAAAENKVSEVPAAAPPTPAQPAPSAAAPAKPELPAPRKRVIEPRKREARPARETRPESAGPAAEGRPSREARPAGRRPAARKLVVPKPPAEAQEEKVERRRPHTAKKEKAPEAEVSKKERKPGKKGVIRERLTEILDDFVGVETDVVEAAPARRRRSKPKRRTLQGAGERAQVRPEKVTLGDRITVAELAERAGLEASEIIKKLFLLGTVVTINQEIDFDTAALVLADFGIEAERETHVDITEFEAYEDEDAPEDLVPRPPVVTVMGHVDHGKTTLLDAIRHSRVAAQEAGGITQHIGAYQVEVGDRKITFLDTPGHEAFTAMRARGAKVTDVVVLVVAADDGVMPQTVEAIDHAKAAGVPIIVAINKIDKPDARPERVKQELTEHGLVPEEWGGDTIFVPVSALKRQGIDELLEMILLVAELRELKANPNRRARGVVLEARLDRGRGPVATLLVQNGTLRQGDALVAGTMFGRVRTMTDDRGRPLKEAPPSTPVEVTGLEGVPEAGDAFMVFEEEEARAIAKARAERRRERELARTRIDLENVFDRLQAGELKELNVILKADVHGSVEALRSALERIQVDGVRVNVVHAGVGAITESDVNLALASHAVIIGFNVRPDANARQLAEREKVDIRLYRVIYEAIEEIERALKGMLEPVYEERVIGTLEVREIFRISRLGTVAGCYVRDGKVTRDATIRVIRDGVLIHTGKIASLKRFKDDVREVAAGYECGILLDGFHDVKPGDVFEAFVLEAVQRV
ncbi:MAG: translation initiation factor IF-2 [Brockia lithotrophica]|nr:translation initiation factor IF-2 [Brockia lithotrophica]